MHGKLSKTQTNVVYPVRKIGYWLNLIRNKHFLRSTIKHVDLQDGLFDIYHYLPGQFSYQIHLIGDERGACVRFSTEDERIFTMTHLYMHEKVLFSVLHNF